MALKKRTFRRIVLLGSVLSIFLVLGLGYFVIRPWNSQRKLDLMLVNGMADHENGDHVSASLNLGRYLNRTDDPEADVILAFARSRIKFQVSDGGHYMSSIQKYREYLIEVPDDLEASKELLPLFNVVGMHLDAKNLAENIRTKLNDSSAEVLREEIYAKTQLLDDETEIDELYLTILNSTDAGFQEEFDYTNWLKGTKRDQLADDFIATRLKADPENMGSQLNAFWHRIMAGMDGSEDMSNVEVVEGLCQILQIDPVGKDWIAEPTGLTVEMGSLVDRFFNLAGRSDLSLLIRRKSVELFDDSSSLIWLARRLYWSNDFEGLFALDYLNMDGDPVVDVLGYQLLAHRSRENTEDQQAVKSDLELIDLDFRSGTWLRFIEGLELLEEGKTVDARAKIDLAVQQYPSEPTFRIHKGDVHSANGRFNEARDEWIEANRWVVDLANEPYRNYAIGKVGWVDPLIRIVNAYDQSGRLAEGLPYIEMLRTSRSSNPVSVLVYLNSYAKLAQAGNLSKQQVEQVLTEITWFEGLSVENRMLFTPAVVTLYATVSRDDEAIRLLQEALSANPATTALVELLNVDERYELGVADELGIEKQEYQKSSPKSALRYALVEFEENDDIEVGLKVLDQGLAQSDEENTYAWGLARAQYLDSTNDPRAVDAWVTLREAHPENLDLLYLIAKSWAITSEEYPIRNTEAAVDEIINVVLTKTSTLGIPAPTRLRLARASAIINDNQTKTARDRAIDIVRSVVSSENENIEARNMLGRLLSLQPSPLLNDADRFEPDIPSAVEQYIAISRQLQGTLGQRYLLESIDLSTQSDDTERARRYLLEFNTKYPADFQALLYVGERFEKINDMPNARDIYRKIYQNTNDLELMINSGLALANAYTVLNEYQTATSLLTDLSEEPELNADQFLKMVLLFPKAGSKSKGDELVTQGEARYGLEPVDAKLAYAKYAASYVSSEAADVAFREVISMDPENEEAWIILARKLIRAKRYDEAQELVASALDVLPDNSDLQVLSVLAQGELTSAKQLLDAEGFDSNPVIEEATSRVDAYMAQREQATVGELVPLLVSMVEDFPRFLPIQKFALTELETIGIDPNVLARFADRAARNFPREPLLYRVAGNAYLRSNQPLEAIRIADLLRATPSGSPMESDLISAKAQIQLENYQETLSLLSVYVLGAAEAVLTLAKEVSTLAEEVSILAEKEKEAELEAVSNLAEENNKLQDKRSMLRTNLDVLYAHSHAQLMVGVDPSIVAQTLEPLLSESVDLRTAVWLNLVTLSLDTHQDAADWLKTLEQYSTDEEMTLVANAWVTTMERFENWDLEYATHAFELVEAVLGVSEDDSTILAVGARTQYAIANASTDENAKAQAYQSSVDLMEQAYTAAPNNPSYLAFAARYANEAELFSVAEGVYRRILSLNLPDSRFLASSKNNLALLIEIRSDDAEELAEAYQMVKEATSQFDVPAFWGTQGWIEMALEDLEASESSFQRVVAQDESNLEGWVGLAIIHYKLGEERADVLSQSLDQVRKFAEDQGISDALKARLLKEGDSEWVSLVAQES
jgi:tetratricopeptide (TPR) repeat protein